MFCFPFLFKFTLDLISWILSAALILLPQLRCFGTPVIWAFNLLIDCGNHCTTILGPFAFSVDLCSALFVSESDEDAKIEKIE